jgi:putative ABC transport system substrate-binding protein
VRRRSFITLLGGAVAAWPVAVRAQQSAMPTIGFISSNAADSTPHFTAAFRQALAENGFIEGKNVAIEFRWAAGRLERLPSMVMDLIRRQVAVLIATGGDEPALIAKGATATIPIVFLTAADPVKSGLVSSLNRPDRNATGATLLGGLLGAKRLEILNELVPRGSTIGILANENNPNSGPEIADVQAAGRVLGERIEVLNGGSPEEIERAFGHLSRSQVAGLLVNPDPQFMLQRERIVALADHLGKPVVYYSREFAETGGLLSYGSSFVWLYRQGGEYVARILKGATPVDLPVVQPTKFELVINLKTAKALGVDVPATLLARADEVIE